MGTDREGREAAKRVAARAAVAYVESGRVVGVGTGSTVAHFIDALADGEARPSAAVATSRDTASRLTRAGIPVVELEEIREPLYLYVDGADEVDAAGRAIKGGGGAHVREKTVARASERWVCIVDEGKVVERLGKAAPVPVEVLADQADRVRHVLRAVGADPRLREGTADSGNPLVDVFDLDLDDVEAAEDMLEAIPGVLGCGIFAHRSADIVVVGHHDGHVDIITPESAAEIGPHESLKGRP